MTFEAGLLPPFQKHFWRVFEEYYENGALQIRAVNEPFDFAFENLAEQRAEDVREMYERIGKEGYTITVRLVDVGDERFINTGYRWSYPNRPPPSRSI